MLFITHRDALKNVQQESRNQLKDALFPICNNQIKCFSPSIYKILCRYGGPYMIPDYGSSELPQAFCRVAAVHGAIYVLRCPSKSLLLSPSGKRCEGVKLETGQVIETLYSTFMGFTFM